LSRALAFGQSHLSTRRYGTVTHQPPELLVAGKLTPAADVYSFGIMSECCALRWPCVGVMLHGTQSSGGAPCGARVALS
jgi:serine/threonine protein kinase